MLITILSSVMATSTVVMLEAEKDYAYERGSYQGRMTPVVSVERQIIEEGMLDYPYGIAAEYQTGNIYVSDQWENRVNVFDSDGKYLCEFGDNMDGSLSLAISENRVFVTQSWSNCVLVYDLNGTFITKLGSRGSGETQFIFPHGIAINEINGDMYVCDTNNNRIQIFSKEFPLNFQFGQGILDSPFDIELTNEYIYVLSNSEHFLHCFSYDFTQTHNTSLTSISKYLIHPLAFCIDGSDHFIISDKAQSAIIIFNQKGELVHTITDSVECPLGVALDSKGRILLVASHHHLLIF